MPNLPWQQNTLAQMTLIGTADTAQIVNTHHFMATGLTEATLTSDAAAISWSGTVADAWIGVAKTAWLACHGTDYVLNMVKCQVVERPANFRHKLSPIERAQTTGNAGAVSGGSQANQVAADIKWRTTLAGKHTRGRSYVGPVPGSYMADGALSAGGQTTYKAYADLMIAQFGVAGVNNANFTLVIYSRPFNKGEYGWPRGKNPNREIYYPDDYAGLATPVVAGQLDTVLRTQRRRELGVGS